MYGPVKTCYLRIGKRRLGFEFSRVLISGTPYLDRWILHLAGPTVRVHRFWRGDDDRAPHSHPWPWFITFPLVSYREDVYSKGTHVDERWVPAWRFSFRGGAFEHIVREIARPPGWTIVITGNYRNDWGFYPQPGVFVPWEKWT